MRGKRKAEEALTPPKKVQMKISECPGGWGLPFPLARRRGDAGCVSLFRWRGTALSLPFSAEPWTACTGAGRPIFGQITDTGHLPGAHSTAGSGVTPRPFPWHLLARAIASARRFARCEPLRSWGPGCWSWKQPNAGFARRCGRSGCGTTTVSNALEYSAVDCSRRSGMPNYYM